jgi:hypothetical protein
MYKKVHAAEVFLSFLPVVLILVSCQKKPEVQILELPNQPVRPPYLGYCDCPYDYDRVGNQCGDRSAYVKTGGRSPDCYTSRYVTVPIAEKPESSGFPRWLILSLLLSTISGICQWYEQNSKNDTSD